MGKRIMLFFVIGILVFSFYAPALADSIILAPSDFSPVSYDTQYTSNWNGLSHHGGGGQFLAPIHLPDGARLTSVVVSYKDNSSVGNINVSLFKENIYNLTTITLADWTSSENTPAYPLMHKISPITGGNTVNNGGYYYNVFIDFTGTSSGYECAVYAIKINYN